MKKRVTSNQAAVVSDDLKTQLGIGMTPAQVEDATREIDPRRGHLDLDIYTVSELAVRLGVKVHTIGDWIKAGELRSATTGPKSGHRILKSWLLEFFEQRAEGGGS